MISDLHGTGNIADPDSQAARNWLISLLDMIAEGGVWNIPRTKSSYIIMHSTKTMKLAYGPGDAPSERVAKSIGWTVEKP